MYRNVNTQDLFVRLFVLDTQIPKIEAFAIEHSDRASLFGFGRYLWALSRFRLRNREKENNIITNEWRNTFRGLEISPSD